MFGIFAPGEQFVSVNKFYLLKPTVKISYDKEGKRTDSERIIDLSKQLNIYIKEEIKASAVESKLRD